MKPALRDDVVYGTPDGRVFCGALRCAGMTAHFTGRGLHGEDVSPLTSDEIREWIREWIREIGSAPSCAGCGREVSLVLNERGLPTLKEAAR